MTRTVRDLVDAFRADEGRSFDPDAVWQRSLRRARQHTLRRRTAVALAAGVAAAAVAAPSVVLTAGSPGPDPVGPGQSGSVSGAPSTPVAPTSSRDAWSETLREVSEGPWLILPTETSPRVQRANVVTADASMLVASVEVYEPGVFDPSPMLDGSRTTVDGEAAYFAWVPDPFQTSSARRALAWRYAQDAWVVLWMEPDTSAPSNSTQIPGELLEIASLVEIGDPEPIRLPFRLGYRPETLVPHSVTHFSATYPNRTVYYEYIDEPVDFWDPQRDLRFPLRVLMRPAMPEQWQPNTTVGGRPAMRVGNAVIVAIDDVWVDIGTGVVNPLATDEIDQIFAGMTFADWNDQSTWFDANTVV